MLVLIVFIHAWVATAAAVSSRRVGASSSLRHILRDRGWARRVNDAGRPPRLAGEVGQTTAEYALILIGAAAIAVLLIGWATKTDAIGKLFDLVIDKVAGRAK